MSVLEIAFWAFNGALALGAGWSLWNSLGP